MFYSLLGVKAHGEYAVYLEKYCARDYCALMNFKNNLISSVLDVSDEFYQLCLELNHKNSKEKYENFVKSCKPFEKSGELNDYCAPVSRNYIQKFRRNSHLIGDEIIKDNIFKIFGYQKNDEILKKALKNFDFLKNNYNRYFGYLYLAITFVENNFPIVLKEKLTNEEKSFINHLLGKGDKLNCSKVFKIGLNSFENKLRKICLKLNAENIEKVLGIAIIARRLF